MPDDGRQGLGPDARVGHRFGDYLVEEEIGRGGMGVVFRARHTATGRVVALKLMAPDLAHNHSFRERFINEAEAAPNLRHPNIVPVLESGEADGELFIAMELVEGTDLKGLIQKEGRLDPKRVLSIFRQAASALDAAHESGMVHRDVKPQNILIVPRETPDGVDQVFLTDFGLVRPVTSETSASRTGQVFGSVAYMAPELIEGIPADGRADVYALGCVLYECLTGNVPFERENEVSAVWAHIHEDPPLLTDTCRDLPGGLNDVVFKAMSKHPDDRFLTAGEFVTELELGLGRKLSTVKYAYIRPLVARVPRKKTEREVWAPNFFPELSRVGKLANKTNWVPVVGATTALMLLAAALVEFAHPRGLTGAVQDVADVGESVVAAVSDLSTKPEPESRAVGRKITDREKDPKRAREDTPPLRKHDRAKLKDLLPVAPGRRSTGPSEPAGGGVEAAPGRPKIVWARGTTGFPDGATNETDLWVMDPDGSNETRLTATAEAEFWPSWSPDGRHIAYVRIAVAGAQEIWIMEADGSDQRDLRLCPGDADCGRLAWAPDGRRVAYPQGQDLYVADLATGTRVRVAAGMLETGSPPEGFMGGGIGPGPTWAPDGRSLAFTCGSSLCLVSAQGGEPREAIEGRDSDFIDPEWSPAGAWIAFGHSANADTWNLFLQRPDGTGRRQLTYATAPGAFNPSWAPGGRALVYADWSQGRGSLFRMDVDGPHRRQLTSGGRDYTPDWWGPSE